MANHWRIILDRHGERDEGDVYASEDGEVIGRWRVDENDFHYFTPSGAAEPIFCDPYLYLFCEKVTDWYLAKR